MFVVCPLDMRAMDNDLTKNASFQSTPGYVSWIYCCQWVHLIRCRTCPTTLALSLHTSVYTVHVGGQIRGL